MFERVAWGLLAAGLLLGVLSGVLALGTVRSMEGMELVPAKVLRRQDVVTHGINRSRPVVGFKTLTGEEVEYVAMNVLKDEEDLHVLYRVGNPKDARVHLGLGEYLVPFILAALALACGGIGGALLKILAEEKVG